MNHPYAQYIEAKAAEYYSRQAHEPHCETLQPYKPCTDSTGFVYDVYITQHCDCWLTENFKNLTLARKFDAMRALSHRFGLHSEVCDRLKRTPITYRGKPEIMTGWCNCWLSVDMDPEPPVEYDQQQPTPTKEHTMSDLIIAKSRAEDLRKAQSQIDTFLAPFIKDYAEFLTAENRQGWDLRDFNADIFVEIGFDHFCLRGEEEYSYGEYYTPRLNLPFAFVEDPAQYKADYRQKEADRKARQEAKAKTSKEEQVARLRAQLAKAEAELTKATQGNDPIKAVANRNRAKELRAQFIDS